MHVPRIEVRSLDETVEAVDLGQTPADVVFLSFSDSDLNALARAYEAGPEPKPTLRIASLAALRHPFSIDLYLERVCARARLVVARVLGGADYWRYGVDELAALARRSGVKLALLPGDRRPDARLDEASTLDSEAVRRIWRYFDEGGPRNMAACLAFFAAEIGAAAGAPPPVPVRAFGRFEGACFEAGAGAPRALIVFYRSVYLAADLAPIESLALSLRDKGFAVTSVFVTSLKDEAALEGLRAFLDRRAFDVVLNATAFSARLDGADGTALDGLDAPVMQVVLAGVSVDAWRASLRGLGSADLAMHVALPEIDGRILTRAISFKAASQRDERTEFGAVEHRALADRVDFVAELASRWANLRRKAPADKRLACVLPDYPSRGGRTGYAVGLDTPASAVAIAETLRAAGYDVACELDAPSLIAALAEGPLEPTLSLAEYEAELASTPLALPAVAPRRLGRAGQRPQRDRRRVLLSLRPARQAHRRGAARPGRPFVAQGRLSRSQPARRATPMSPSISGSRAARRSMRSFNSGLMARSNGCRARRSRSARACAPEVVIGPTPVVYPFIVNNPGEAAQAKRRIGAATIGHLTPPLIAAGSHGPALELEGLFDEFAEAQGLDPRRARAIAALILERGRESGLLKECAAEGKPPEEALVALDAWLCDLKDMRIGDGLHVFGRSPESADGFAAALDLVGGASKALSERVAACGSAESLGLLRALGGRFVAPGPAGAPARGRLDVLPTGRNLYAIDPRAAPTRNAWEIGRRAAEEVLARYAQDHGDWPRRIVIDLWGSATMRTGGDDLAQAFALIGCRPTWDASSSRVSGFEVLPLAMLGRPRVDVTLRISGLFRDVFPSQIALFAAAVRAVAAREESADDNPLAGLEGASLARVFGAAPGAYGVGLGRRIAEGDWAERSELAEAYLAATSHAYDGEGEGREAAAAFRARVAGAEAFVHAQDLPGEDALDADAFAEHEGGFAAAAAEAGANPALYHLDSTAPGTPKIRTLRAGDRALSSRPRRQSALAPRPDASRPSRRGRNRPVARQSLLLRRADRCGRQRTVRPHVRRNARRRRRARVPGRRQSPGGEPHGGRLRGGGAARLLALAPQFERAHSGVGPGGGAHERDRAPPEGLVSGGVAADGDRRRAHRPGAGAARAIVARSGRGGGGERASLRQWRARPLFARQSAPARLERAQFARPACAPRRRRAHRRRSRGRAAAQHRREPARRHRSRRPRSISGRASPRSRRGSPADGALRQLPAKFSFVLDAHGRLPLADVDADIRFEASLEGTLAVYLAGDDALAAECAPGETGEIAARLGRAFVRLAGAGESAAAADARARRAHRGDGRVRRSGSRRRGRARVRRRRASLGDLLGAHEFGAAVVVGAAAAFGEIEADRFLALIERARALGASGLRLTPWRAFLIAGLDREAADVMVDSIARLGFINRRGRAAPPHRRLPGRARLHARPSAGARGRNALGGAHAEGRGRRSACQRLRQGMRAARPRRRPP